MNAKQAHHALTRLTVRAVQPGLKRSRFLLDRRERPDLSFPTIHITGTNGKGSVVALLATVLVEAGYRVGCFTSPHLGNERERITINNQPVSSRLFSAAVSRLLPALRALRHQGNPATTFEAWSVLAADLFRAQAVDIAVVEVGMGGRLDATTAWNKRCLTVLTNVALEHTAYLGKTKLSILREKLGITLRQVPLITGEADPALRKVIKHWCHGQRVPLWFAGTGKQNDAQITTWKPTGTGGRLRANTRKGKQDLAVGLSGAFQAGNAAVALLALEQLNGLGFPVSPTALSKGFRSARWPGRMETVRKRPLVILDGAHNAAAIKASIAYWQKSKRKIDIVVGMMGDKDVREMVNILARVGRRVWTVTPPDPRGVLAHELAVFFYQQGVAVQPCETIAQAMRRALQAAGSKGTILVTGSLYNVEPARRALKFWGHHT